MRRTQRLPRLLIASRTGHKTGLSDSFTRPRDKRPSPHFAGNTTISAEDAISRRDCCHARIHLSREISHWGQLLPILDLSCENRLF